MSSAGEWDSAMPAAPQSMFLDDASSAPAYPAGRRGNRAAGAAAGFAVSSPGPREKWVTASPPAAPMTPSTAPAASPSTTPRLASSPDELTVKITKHIAGVGGGSR